MVEREINERVELLDRALVKLRDSKKELDKLRPDVKSYGATGEVAHELYSEEMMKKRKAATEQLSKLENAVEKALTGEDWNKLKEIINK